MSLAVSCLQFCKSLRRTSLVAQMVKHLPTMQESWVWSLGQEDPLEKEMVTHSGTLAWKIPWTKEYGRLLSMGSQRVGYEDMTEQLHLSFFFLRRVSINSFKYLVKLTYEMGFCWLDFWLLTWLLFFSDFLFSLLLLSRLCICRI